MTQRAAVAAAGACALAALTGCGSGSGSGGGGAAKDPLTWQTPPRAFRPPDLRSDRVVVARVRNRSSETVRLDASEIVVRDAGGRRLRGFGQYIATFARGLYGAYQKPDPLPPDELRRLGLRITLAPGRTAPLVVTWRLAPGSREPATVDYGPGTLTLPRGATASR